MIDRGIKARNGRQAVIRGTAFSLFGTGAEIDWGRVEKRPAASQRAAFPCGKDTSRRCVTRGLFWIVTRSRWSE